MNDSPKIQLSPFEKQLVTDSSWLLTKNTVLEKIKQLLASVYEGQRLLVTDAVVHIPEEVLLPSPKISRGENYLGLPWMVLDYPRYFDRDHLFAVRTMFWWGNFFSVTLLLSGRHKNRFSERIADQWETLRNDEFYVSHNSSPWNHHFEPDNYLALRNLKKDEFIAQVKDHPFLKLAKKKPLEDLELIGQKLLDDFEIVIRLFQQQK